eukprot:scaffold102907_cov34-Tisochrysis_lutea.AAC.4
MLGRMLPTAARAAHIGVSLGWCDGDVVRHGMHLNARGTLKHFQILKHLLAYVLKVLPRVRIFHGRGGCHMQVKVGGKVFVIVVPGQLLNFKPKMTG